jgi:hypothetical protein
MQNAALAALIFDLAYSYADSGDETIPLELARLYSKNSERAQSIPLCANNSETPATF